MLIMLFLLMPQGEDLFASEEELSSLLRDLVETEGQN